MKLVRIVGASAGVLLLVAALGGCTTTNGNAQQQAQNTTNTYQNAAQTAVPYPLSQMESGDWLERSELRMHLLRQNDKNATRWVIMLDQQGQIVAQWPIQGMVFDPNSQMTNSQTINDCSQSGSACGVVTDAPGDNGTWGPEAGAAAFFTTSGVEIQLPGSALWIESDAPLGLTSAPLVTYNVNSAPSVSDGGVKVGGQ